MTFNTIRREKNENIWRKELVTLVLGLLAFIAGKGISNASPATAWENTTMDKSVVLVEVKEQ